MQHNFYHSHKPVQIQGAGNTAHLLIGKRAKNTTSCPLSTKHDIKQLEISVVSKLAVQAEDKGEHGSYMIQ